jgi:hypothetical protein
MVMVEMVGWMDRDEMDGRARKCDPGNVGEL